MRESERGILWVLGGLVLVLLAGPVLMGGLVGPGMMGPGMMGWSTAPGAATNTSGWAWGLAMGLGGLMMLAFWGAIIADIVFLVRSMGSQRPTAPGPTGGEEPLAILHRRYAAGEIDQATYERMRAELGRPLENVPRQAVGAGDGRG